MSRIGRWLRKYIWPAPAVEPAVESVAAMFEGENFGDESAAEPGGPPDWSIEDNRRAEMMWNPMG